MQQSRHYYQKIYYNKYNSTEKQVSSQPTNALILIDTLQFCNQIGNQSCIFIHSNFKILFYQTKDNFGNWLLNDESQDIGLVH